MIRYLGSGWQNIKIDGEDIYSIDHNLIKLNPGAFEQIEAGIKNIIDAELNPTDYEIHAHIYNKDPLDYALLLIKKGELFFSDWWVRKPFELKEK
jgi:hypothetical protein